MLAWSIGTGLVVCWALTAFAIVTGTIMIRMEDAELEERFWIRVSSLPRQSANRNAETSLTDYMAQDAHARVLITVSGVT